jgi:hypothetical protein
MSQHHAAEAPQGLLGENRFDSNDFTNKRSCVLGFEVDKYVDIVVPGMPWWIENVTIPAIAQGTMRLLVSILMNSL